MPLKEARFEGWYIVELYSYDKQPVYATKGAFKYVEELAKMVENEIVV